MGTELKFHQVEKHGPIVVWRFSNPPRNLASMETMAEYQQLLEELENDPELHVGIITSATPGMFIQHFDVSAIADWAETFEQASEEEIAAMKTEAEAEEQKTPDEYTSKPVICAINGPLEGGGCELSLYCDFRFMSRDTFMGQPEINAGFPPGYGIPRMIQLIGLGKTMELCMTGRRVFADEAERIGLITRACDPDQLESEVFAFAMTLASKSPVAISLIKKTILGCCDLTLKEGLKLNQENFGEGIQSDYARLIMRAYVAAGQDGEKLTQVLTQTEGDFEKAIELLEGST
jgi:enoyl-CoA hydratase/carnithine racemase